MGSFLFRWPHPEANDVHVTGTFDGWRKSVRLNKVGDIWEKDVDLPKAEKILYKFVVNDQWIIDPEAPQEDDGRGNINNVLHPEQLKRKTTTSPGAVTTSSAAPESTTAALAGRVPLESKKEATEVTPADDLHLNQETSRNSIPGTFPETPANEKESYGVNPLPPSEGATNPITLPAGEKVPPPGEISSNTTRSAVTTSQEDYEKAGSSIPYFGGALAALGLGGIAGGALAKKDNLIPESSLPVTQDAGASSNASPFVSSSGPNTTTSELASKVPLEETKVAETSAVPEVVKESIAKAHTEPEATTSTEAVKEKTEVEQELLQKVPTTTEAGEHAPTIAAATSTVTESASSAPVAAVPEVVKESIAEAHISPEAATSTEAVKEKSAVEQELLKKVPSTDEAGEPAPTIAAATSATVPSANTESTTAPGTSSAAAAAVADGTDGAEPAEASKTIVTPEKTEADNTEYAPPHAPTTAPGVSESAAAAVSDGAEDPTLLDEPAVQMMNQNDAEAAEPLTSSEPAPAHDETTVATPAVAPASTPAAPEPKEEVKAATPAAPTSATSTPTKQPAITTPSSTPGSTATKEKKKKNRVSSFFKKIFD